MTKRSKQAKIVEAERLLRENSIGWLRREGSTLREYQQKSLEPKVWDSSIAEVDRKLVSSQDQGLKDLWAYVLHEKGRRSWQQIGDQLYRNVKGKEARRLRARRACQRADLRLEELRADGLAAAVIS